MEIQGFENYLIFPDGRVWSNKRNKFLKPSRNKRGYYHVGIRSNNKKKIFTIHRLIGIYYIPNIENKPFIDHINRDKTDNRIENLRWVTPSQNGQNVGITKRNTSGHKNISYCTTEKKWRYHKNGFNKYCKCKIDCLCFKFITLLKLNLI